MALATSSLRRSLASLSPEKQGQFVDSLDGRLRAALSLELERDSLMDFIPAATPALVSPRHLKPLVDVLEHCVEEPCRVVISTPPQHGKTVVCQNALVWLLAHRNPALRHAYISYDSNRAEQISLECQQLADNIELKYTGSRKHWVTRQGGGVHATGIGGPLTGYGVNGCFPAGTLIETSAGAVDIETLARLEYRPYVLAFNHVTGRTEYRRVLAARRLSRPLVVVRTSSGREIRTTCEHPFFVRESGYRAAALLRPGDRLVALAVAEQQDVRAMRSAEERPRSGVPEVLQHQARDHRDAGVRAVRQGNATASVPVREGPAPRSRAGVLLQAMREQGSERESAGEGSPTAGAGTASMFGLLDGGQQGHHHEPMHKAPGAARADACDEEVRMRRELPAKDVGSNTLLSGVREPHPLGPHDWEGQLKLQGRHELRQVVSQHEAADSESGPRRLRNVLQSSPTGGSPYRREAAEQFCGESRYDVHGLPRLAPQVENDTVASVEEVRGGSVDVYDLQVEGLCNFFAGEVLVHNCLLVDDPVKNRAEAESALFRERTDQWFRDVALTRTHPGASVIVVQTRWHPDDLAGRLVARGWQSINLPAIDDDGQALWPETRPLEWLQEKRTLVGEYTWSSLFQGRPVARGGAVFGDVHLCDQLPVSGYRVAIGIDCAYTAKTHADYSCAVVLVKVPDARARDGSIVIGPIYVADVVRMQVQVPQFAARLNLLRAKYRNPRALWYTSTTEQGLAQMFNPPVEARLAKADKFVRAQPAAAAWNAGKIFVPRGAPWADAFLSEVCSFTGVHDPHDDQVDALAAAYDALMGKQPVVTQPILTPLSELG